MSDKLIKEIDGALEAIAPQVKDVLSGEWSRLEHPDVKHWVRAGVEPDGAVRIVGQAAGLDAVGSELRRGARFRETELPEPTQEHVRQFYSGAIERGETTTLAMLLGRAEGASPAPALPAPKKTAKRSRRAKR